MGCRLSLPLNMIRRPSLAGVVAARLPPQPVTITRLGYGGRGAFAGTVSDRKGVAMRRLVRLYSAATGALVAQQWSDQAGAYRFDYLDTDQRFFVVATDHERVYNLTGLDHMSPNGGGG